MTTRRRNWDEMLGDPDTTIREWILTWAHHNRGYDGEADTTHRHNVDTLIENDGTLARHRQRLEELRISYQDTRAWSPAMATRMSKVEYDERLQSLRETLGTLEAEAAATRRLSDLSANWVPGSVLLVIRKRIVNDLIEYTESAERRVAIYRARIADLRLQTGDEYWRSSLEKIQSRIDDIGDSIRSREDEIRDDHAWATEFQHSLRNL